jgi:hypothetical protein
MSAADVSKRLYERPADLDTVQSLESVEPTELFHPLQGLILLGAPGIAGPGSRRLLTTLVSVATATRIAAMKEISGAWRSNLDYAVFSAALPGGAQNRVSHRQQFSMYLEIRSMWLDELK